MFLIYYIFKKNLIHIYFYISRVESETQVQTRQPWSESMTASNPGYHFKSGVVCETPDWTNQKGIS